MAEHMYRDHAWFLLADLETNRLTQCFEIYEDSLRFSRFLDDRFRSVKVDENDKKTMHFAIPFDFIKGNEESKP